MADKTFDLAELIKRCQEGKSKQKKCFLNSFLGPEFTCKYQSEQKINKYLDEKGFHSGTYHDCLKEQKCQ